MTRRPRLKRAFTLIELLVVITIVAILLALMMPAMSKARDQTYLVKCAANLRSIGLATNTYLNDNQWAFPSYSDPTYRLAPYTNHPQYPNGSYIGSTSPQFLKSVFYDPAADGKPRILGDGDWANIPYGGSFQGLNCYGFNPMLQGAPPTYPYWWSASPYQIKLHQLSSPAQVMWSIDGWGFRVDPWYLFVAYNRHLLGNLNDVNSTNNIANDDGQNILYVDGHVTFARPPKDPANLSRASWAWPWKWQ
jgi:prepilin-type N-terminal cleavage/methylation domain-containing protein/prepilin-type processing-associated H-X9-DG protein